MTKRRAEIVKTFTQDDFDRFAALSGDYNPIHIDPDFASKTRFGKTVAHGALLVTILRSLTEQLFEEGQQVSHKIKFTAPTFAGDTMKFSASILKSTATAHHVLLHAHRQIDGMMTCEGEAVIYLGKDAYANRG